MRTTVGYRGPGQDRDPERSPAGAKALGAFLEGARSPNASRESGNPRGIRMGPAGRLRLFTRLLRPAAADDEGPADPHCQAPLLAFAAGSTTPRAGFRTPGETDP